MIKFEYTYLDISSYDRRINCGFHFIVGDEWDDAIIYPLNREGKIFGKYKTIKLEESWIEKFCSFINEQKCLKSLSSWIYKNPPHSTEHRFAIEGVGWYTEITLYNLGRLTGHIHKEYKEDEIVLLEFFHKVQELFKEVEIDLQYNEIKY